MAKTVLVIDDDRTLVEMLTFMLKRFGFESRIAHNGAQALEIVNGARIDLVVLDVMLPDIDGFDLCRRIRSILRGSEIPILIFSARSQVADRVTGFEAGADDYIAKPVVMREVIDRIRTHLSRSQRLRDEVTPIVLFVGAKGGVGVTTTATNVAWSLARAHRRTIYLDLGFAGLGAAWLLGLHPSDSLLKLGADKGLAFTMVDLQGAMMAHSSGLQYLPGHPHQLSPIVYSPGLLAETLGLLQLHYDVVLIDLALGALVSMAEVPMHASLIIPVCDRDASTYWNLKALLPWLHENQLTAKVPGLVVVDRCSASYEETPAQIAQKAGLSLLARIPPATELLYRAGRAQQPLCAFEPECPASLAYADLARRLTQNPVEPLAPTE